VPPEDFRTPKHMLAWYTEPSMCGFYTIDRQFSNDNDFWHPCKSLEETTREHYTFKFYPDDRPYVIEDDYRNYNKRLFATSLFVREFEHLKAIFPFGDLLVAIYTGYRFFRYGMIK